MRASADSALPTWTLKSAPPAAPENCSSHRPISVLSRLQLTKFLSPARVSAVNRSMKLDSMYKV